MVPEWLILHLNVWGLELDSRHAAIGINPSCAFGGAFSKGLRGEGMAYNERYFFYRVNH